MVTPCRRFEEEGLRLLERGMPLGDHFDTCSDCLEARRAYRTLQADLGRLGEGVEPPAHWQESVRQRIQAQEVGTGTGTVARPTMGRSSWGGSSWGGLVAAVLAMAIVGLVFFRPSVSPTLTVEVQPGSSTLRGAGAQPGDLLVLVGTFGASADTRDTELRLYRNDDTLVARCPGSESCEISRRQMRLTITLPATGTYQPILAYGPEPLPEGGAGLDPDSGAILEAGGRVELGDEIEVR